MFKKIVKFVFIMALVFTSAFSFSQNEIPKNEEYDEAKLNQVLSDFNEKAQRPEADITDEELNQEEMKEFDQFANEVKVEEVRDEKAKNKKSKTPINLEGKKLSETLPYLLEPFDELNDQELRQVIMDKFNGGSIGGALETYPFLLELSVKLVRDKKALVGLVKISEQPSKVQKLLLFLIGTLVLGHIIKKALFREDRPFATALFYSFLRIVFMNGLRLYIIYSFFSEELGPALKIFRSVVFS